jgi:hypothetical protein
MVDFVSRKPKFERVPVRLHGISFARGVKGINHSQFANDTLLIGGASTVMAKKFKYVMENFLNAFGGEVNNKKNHIYGLHISINMS